MLKVCEIFESIEGEGIRSGLPVVFIRLFGCNCRCDFCDSLYAVVGNEYKEMTVSEIYQAIVPLEIPNITLTGGEPLLDPDVLLLIRLLTEQGYEVNIETNGSIDLRMLEGQNRRKIIVTMDWKSPSSKMNKKMLESNLRRLTERDVLKFVVQDAADMHEMKRILDKYPNLRCHIFVSPVFGKMDPQVIVGFLRAYKIRDIRLQLQLHKIIWDPDQRGV